MCVRTRQGTVHFLFLLLTFAFPPPLFFFFFLLSSSSLFFFHLSFRWNRVTIAVVLLVIFALLAQVELTKLNEASKDEIIPNLDSIIDSLDSIEKGVDESYQMTQYMPLLYEMNTLSGYIEGNLTITVDAMTKSPLFLSGGFGR